MDDEDDVWEWLGMPLDRKDFHRAMLEQARRAKDAKNKKDDNKWLQGLKTVQVHPYPLQKPPRPPRGPNPPKKKKLNALEKVKPSDDYIDHLLMIQEEAERKKNRKDPWDD